MATLVSFLFFKLGGPVPCFPPGSFQWLDVPKVWPISLASIWRETDSAELSNSLSQVVGSFVYLAISPHPAVLGILLPSELRFRQRKRERERQTDRDREKQRDGETEIQRDTKIQV